MISHKDTSVYVSDMLGRAPGIVHAFFTRIPGDARTVSVQRSVAAYFGRKSKDLCFVRQVHGAGIYSVLSEQTVQNTVQADALTAVRSTTTNVLLAIKTADCLPVLLADAEQGIICAVHAGWRGTLAGITRRAVNAMIQLGAKPEGIIAALGPHIGRCCYTVDSGLAARFAEICPDSVSNRDAVWSVDLGLANRTDLVTSGVPPGNIDNSGPCTKCHADEFFSYRVHAGGAYGQQMSLIGFA